MDVITRVTEGVCEEMLFLSLKKVSVCVHLFESEVTMKSLT